MGAFPAVRIEGGLLAPDLLEEVLAGQLSGQRPGDFGLPERRSLTDEVAAAFAEARAHWAAFTSRLARLPEADPATTVTRDSWVIPLLSLLGYEPHYQPRAHAVDGLTFAISHRADGGDEAPPVHIVGARQELGRLAPSGRPRLAPHSLLQEYLNRTEHLWGIVTNGLTLRVLRDSTFVRRQAYLEFDLPAMLEEQRFTDFALLYRLLHRTRLPRGTADAPQCLLEQYHQHSLEQGGRVRERLREGVEECLKVLGNGFLRHPGNAALRRRLAGPAPGELPLSPEELYRQLLRLVYRLLFLMVCEERNLLSANPVYRRHYGLERLRRLVDRRAAYTDHEDLWHGLRVLWRCLADERLAALLDLAPLNGELFAWQELDDCSLSNRDLLSALWHLHHYRDRPGAPPRRVNYAALDVEELGSVYESLLEYHPTLTGDSGSPGFALTFGSERKTTGSYYTPPQLVGELVSSALEPVLQERLDAARTPAEKERAILALKVCDPACGSGHFLLAAARRLGKELARVRTGEEEPAPEAHRQATREVIAHCLYGVDRNPLAVELCRVALWLEGHTGDKPLTFLYHRIRCGDSLLGVWRLEGLKDGIPDEAFAPLEGDDRELARALVRRNRSEREGQGSLFAWDAGAALTALGARGAEVDAAPDTSPQALAEKKRRYVEACRDPERVRLQQACDLWAAAFFQPLRPGRAAITSAAVLDRLAGRAVPGQLLGAAAELTLRHRFFHWPLEFSEVFAAGGFDVVLSNPPWEHVELKEQEFFTARDPRIAAASTKAARTELIGKLKTSNPDLFEEYRIHLRSFDAARNFMGNSRRFALTGRGRINTYAVFAELARAALGPGGRAGIIVPTGIATDDTTKFFFQDLMRSGALASLYDFENRRKIFQDIDSRLKFCLLTLHRAIQRKDVPAQFVFFALGAEDLRRSDKRFSLTAEEMALLNPNTGNCPIFRTRADAELTKAIYRRVPVLWREGREGAPEENPWRLQFSQGLFNMSSDSHHFRTAPELRGEGYRLEGNVFVGPRDRYLPLYEAKMVHQFDHRWATYDEDGTTRDVTEGEKRDPAFVVQPRYWVQEEVVEAAIPAFPAPLAAALRLGDREAAAAVLQLLAQGWHLLRGQPLPPAPLRLGQAFSLPREVARVLAGEGRREQALALARDFPLREEEVARILSGRSDPLALARELVGRCSPRWFLGWRDITNSTNERTLIASAVPRVGVGHTFPLIFLDGAVLRAGIGLVSKANSLVFDFSARQKVGGTHITYSFLKQFPFAPPRAFEVALPWLDGTLGAWVGRRALELLYTAHDLTPLARDLGEEGPPFPWDGERRFEIRCELDAAFFHLYLPATPEGRWRPARVADGHVVDESRGQLQALEEHFPTPRDAVRHILDQFPIVRAKEEARFGFFRTRERILALWDELLACQRAGRPFRSRLDPPPGQR